MAKQRLLQLNKVVYFPWRLHIGSERIAEGIPTSRKPHTRGNPDAEILQGVDNPNKLIRNKGKYQLDIIQFGNSLKSLLKSKSNFERSLLKSKLQSDLKSTELNLGRLD